MSSPQCFHLPLVLFGVLCWIICVQVAKEREWRIVWDISGPGHRGRDIILVHIPPARTSSGLKKAGKCRLAVHPGGSIAVALLYPHTGS